MVFGRNFDPWQQTLSRQAIRAFNEKLNISQHAKGSRSRFVKVFSSRLADLLSVYCFAWQGVGRAPRLAEPSPCYFAIAKILYEVRAARKKNLVCNHAMAPGALDAARSHGDGRLFSVVS